MESRFPHKSLALRTVLLFILEIIAALFGHRVFYICSLSIVMNLLMGLLAAYVRKGKDG